MNATTLSPIALVNPSCRWSDLFKVAGGTGTVLLDPHGVRLVFDTGRLVEVQGLDGSLSGGLGAYVGRCIAHGQTFHEAMVGLERLLLRLFRRLIAEDHHVAIEGPTIEDLQPCPVPVDVYKVFQQALRDARPTQAVQRDYERAMDCPIILRHLPVATRLGTRPFRLLGSARDHRTLRGLVDSQARDPDFWLTWDLLVFSGLADVCPTPTF